MPDWPPSQPWLDQFHKGGKAVRQRAFLIIRKHANKTPNSPRQHSCENVKNTLEEGCLAGSVRKACGSRYQGDEFEPHVLCRDYLSKYIFFFFKEYFGGNIFPFTSEREVCCGKEKRQWWHIADRERICNKTVAVEENGPPWALQGTSVAVKWGTFSSDL